VRDRLKWEPELSFSEMVKEMVEEDHVAARGEISLRSTS
jgi:GDP-D-mannose dehydratase